MFSELYEKHFPLKDFQIKVKNLEAPWISKGLKKSSKQKQKLYIKFLKNKSIQNEQIYKNYKHLFEKLTKKANQTYYQSILTWHAHGKQWRKSREKVKLTLTDFLNQ